MLLSSKHPEVRLHDLQDRLRIYMRARLHRTELTGSVLSREAGFRQGHLSNFLNCRRGLSLAAMDRLLDALGIDVLDLLNAEDIERRAVVPGSEADSESVVMIPAENSFLANFTPGEILGTKSFQKSFLRKLRRDDVDGRGHWQRFVQIRLASMSVLGMFPFEPSTVRLLVNRHYNSLEPYRRRPNVYVVRFKERYAVGYVSALGDHLILQSCDRHNPFESVRTKRGNSYSEHIVGRVCLIEVGV